MSKKMLIVAIKNQENISKLETLRDVGLDKLIGLSCDICQSDKAELIETINNRIIELGGTI